MKDLRRLVAIYCALAGILSLSSCATVPSETQESDSGDKEVDFVMEVKPILEERCVMCHNRATLPERTSFENRKLALKGDSRGAVILPGNANDSRLLAAVLSPDTHEQAMPPVSVRVSEEEIALLTRWINEGAAWPEGEDGELVPDFIPME